MKCGMLYAVFLLVLLRAQCQATSGLCAKNVLFDTKVTRQFNKDTQKEVRETKISFTIGFQETVCFEVLNDPRYQPSDPTVDDRKYYFSFEDVKSIFTYKNAYTFGMGDPKVKCLCDCPGVENHCSPSRDSCKKDGNSDADCFNYYSDDHATEGCGFASFLGSGEVCCSISIKTTNSTKYTAFEVSTPVNRARFRVEKDVPYERREFSSDLGSGSPHFDGTLQVSFMNPGNINPIGDGWYFGQLGEKRAYTNVEVNGLMDWDVNKLGWYKYQNNKYSISQTAVKNAFDSHVLNCDDSELNVDFYTEANLSYAKPFEEFYQSTIKRAVKNDDDRNLILSYHQFSKINIVITIAGAKRVIQEFSMPSFLDFRGAALFDKHSNRFLNVTIVSGKGTLYGTLKIGNSVGANFDLTIVSDGDMLTNYTTFIQITQWCNETMVADLCFHAGDNREQCKSIECNEEPLIDFELPLTEIEYDKAEKPNFFGLSTWSKYINPMEWFNGIDNWQEGVIMLISIVMYIVIIGIIVKLVRCFQCGIDVCSCIGRVICSCCRCFKKKNKEKWEYDDYEKSSKRGTLRSTNRQRRRLSPRSSCKSNISERQRQVTQNRGRGIGGSFRRAGNSVRTAGTSIRDSFTRNSRRMIKKYGTHKYVMLQRILNTLSVEEINALRDDYPLDERSVCLDIDSEGECYDDHQMYNPHRRIAGPNRSKKRNKSNRITRSQPIPTHNNTTPSPKNSRYHSTRSNKSKAPIRNHRSGRRTPRGSKDRIVTSPGRVRGPKPPKEETIKNRGRGKQRKKKYDEDTCSSYSRSYEDNRCHVSSSPERSLSECSENQYEVIKSNDYVINFTNCISPNVTNENRLNNSLNDLNCNKNNKLNRSKSENDTRYRVVNSKMVNSENYEKEDKEKDQDKIKREKYALSRRTSVVGVTNLFDNIPVYSPM